MSRRIGIQPLSGRRSGFTLVELLVVIVIISILIALLVPAVGAVQRAAKNGATKAVIASLDQGLETYKADQKLGGAYPPSFSDALSSSGQVQSPYPSPIATQFRQTGAGLLTWALSGADGLGTPGFKRVRSGSTGWYQDTDAIVNTGPSDSGLYALYASGPQQGEPVHPRSGPYVDGSKVTMTRLESSHGFAVPVELSAFNFYGASAPPKRSYPMYLDAFGYPILYWRADPAGRVMADGAPGGPVAPPANQRGKYHYEDNRALVRNVNPGTDDGMLLLSQAGEQHAMEWDTGFAPNLLPTNYTMPAGCFTTYICDRHVTARFEPQRADSYLLVSPGFDGRYGTADDVTNFSPNGQ